MKTFSSKQFSNPLLRKAGQLTLAVAVAAALAACGGGGGGGDAAPAANTDTDTGKNTGGTTTTATTPGGTTLNANTGTSSGRPDSEPPVVTPGLPAAPIVPVANTIDTSDVAGVYPDSPQSLNLYNVLKQWRALLRFEDENGGTELGVGLMTQRANLDTLAADLATSAPDLTSLDPAALAAAVTAAQTQMTGLGYAVSYVAAASTAPASGLIGIDAGPFCAKAIMSSLSGAEIGTAGMRFAGFYSPETPGGNCVMLTALETVGTWQLPSTGSSAVYPYPGKQLTLPRYYGDWAALGFASQPGHGVYVSVASVDALPTAIPGAGSGAAIATSAITVHELSLKLKGSGSSADTPVPARLFARPGMQADTGVTLISTDQFKFSTSIALIPEQPLQAEAEYSATFRATVNGRAVSRTWEFTTSN